MFLWPTQIELRDALEFLPEPVLIVGNKLIDADSAGCIAALMTWLREEGVEVYTHFSRPPGESLGWMFDSTDVNDTILEDYASLIVVDDYVDSERLGIPIKDYVPIVNIDHHSSRRPKLAVDEKEHTGTIFVEVVDRQITFWGLMPAAACLLIRSGIFHPYLWLSLYSDTVAFSVAGADTPYYLVELMDGLAQQGEPFTNEIQEAMHQKYTQIGSLSSLDTLLNSRIYTFGGTYQDKPIQICIGIIDSDSVEAAYKALATLRAYSHVTCLISSKTGKVSLRSRNDDFDVCKIAMAFGGGGHIRAAGCGVETGENFLSQVDKMTDLLLEGVSNVRTKIYI